jgi:hypothetical protein
MAEERDKPARRPAEKQEPAEQGTPDIQAREAAELATGTASRAMEDIKDLARDADGPLSRDVGAAAAESDVTDEADKTGVAFGNFVKQVGLAVAAAQDQLDKTLVDTAKALSEAKIKTVAVFEQQINDETGLMDEGHPHIQELPLTNYLMPTAYQWSRVYLEADMNIQEFNSRTGFNIQQKHFSADTRITGNAGMLGWGVSGTAGVSYGQSSTGVDASYGSDLAAGKLHMEATLEPRHDVELPKPFILQKGPRLELVLGSREEITEADGDGKPPKIVGHKVKLIAKLLKSDDSPNTAKLLRFNVSDATLNWHVTRSTDGKTTNDGVIEYEISRRGTPEQLASALPATVRVSFGLVNGAAAVSL